MKKALTKSDKNYWGNLTDVSGDLTECELTNGDRENGVDINDLICQDRGTK